MIDRSQRVRAEDFGQDWFKEVVAEMGQPFTRFRKLWEWAVIAQVYRERGGGSALGFGVGTEPLPEWMASMGGAVMATDLPAGDAKSWVATKLGYDKMGQHLSLRDQAAGVTYADVDMRAIPEYLRCGGFDFTWSSGSFEHIGGIEAGLDFFCQQMECLRPGGTAAHTTEFNYASNDGTIKADDLVLYRRCDLEGLAERLHAQGDRLLPLDLTPGTTEADLFVDEHPYHTPHLNIRINDHVTTSVLLVAERRPVL